MYLYFNRKVFVLAFICLISSCHNKKDLLRKNDTVKNQSDNSGIKEKLGITNKELKENKLFRFVNEWYGVPYKYGGCVKSGVDCSCFANNLYEAVYARKTARNAGDIFIDCDKISVDKIRQGDFVFFKINSSSISHVGVYLKNNLFVHASTSKGVRIDNLEDAYYKKYFYTGGRLKHSS